MVPNQEALTNYLNRELQVIQTRFSHYEINTYYELYQNIDFPLQQIFSALHYELNQIFSHLNTRIPHGYFKADDSRYLLELIRRISNYQTKLHNTEYQFNLATYYSRLFTECKNSWKLEVARFQNFSMKLKSKNSIPFSYWSLQLK